MLFAKSPFFFGVGNNDVHFFALFRAKLNQEEYIDSLVQTYNSTLHTLYNLGVRKFGIIGVPYIGCSPLMRVTTLHGNCSDIANALARQLNEGIEHMLQDMMASLKGMIYSFGNTYDTLYDLYETPEQFSKYQ